MVRRGKYVRARQRQTETGVFMRLLLLVLILSGCSSFGTSVPDSIGAAYASIETLAEVIQMECGNTEPGGPCRDISTLDRGDVNSMKEDLQRAKTAVDQANMIYMEGGDARSSLEAARLILSSLRAALQLREVQ